MSNYSTAKEELLIYIRARTPFIVVESSERERVETMLAEIVAELNTSIDYYTESKQIQTFGSSRGLTSDANHDPLMYGFNKFSKSQRSIFAIGDITKIDSDNAYSREFLNLLYAAKDSLSTLIVITADPIWQRLSVLGTMVKLDFPDHDEIVEKINNYVAQYSSCYPIDWTTDDIDYVATLLKGFSEVQLENALSAELISRNGLNKESIFALSRKKNKLYGSVGAVQLIRVPDNVRVSGMSNLKDWLSQKRVVFFASDDTLAKYDLKVPKGILLAGIPGCGKSFCAKMVAREWGLPLYKFNIDSLFDKWMGESERKMRESLQFIDNVSPCVLWIDEIEKVLSTTDSSNDTGNRILGQFLFWLQESPSRVFLVATANSVDRLPAELFRKGRFSEIFFADLPNHDERAQAIRQYAASSLHLNFPDDEINQMAVATDGYSYSDIETAIKEIAHQLIIDPNTPITTEIIIKKIQSFLPITKSNPELVKKCREWGSAKAINVSSKEA